jgi:hypothetical protein
MRTFTTRWIAPHSVVVEEHEMDRMEEDVARRAYELFIARGGQHGGDLDDWLEAERQLAGIGTPASSVRRHIGGRRATRPAAARQRLAGGTSPGGS